MELYLLRHGTAVPRGTPGFPTDDRPLSKDGKSKMRKASEGIRALIPSVDVIFTSPLQRALSTATIAAEALNLKQIVKVSEALLPGTSVNEVHRLLDDNQKKKSMLIVGHEPLLGEFSSHLLGMKQPAIAFKKGGLCKIEITKGGAPTSGTLIWHITPKQLRIISDIKKDAHKSADKTTSISRPAHRRRGN